jgi:Tfp pilus assembly protein PilF
MRRLLVAETSKSTLTATAYENLGMAYLQQGNFEEAIAALERYSNCARCADRATVSSNCDVKASRFSRASTAMR